MRYLSSSSNFDTSHALGQAAPGVPWTCTIKTRWLTVSDSNCMGILVQNAAANRAAALKINVTISSAAAFDIYDPGLVSDLYPREWHGDIAYLRMQWTGAAFRLYCSVDGTGWALMGQRSPTLWTPNVLGVFVWANNNSGVTGERWGSFRFFRVTTP
jgi:hypothetical protein